MRIWRQTHLLHGIPPPLQSPPYCGERGSSSTYCLKLHAQFIETEIRHCIQRGEQMLMGILWVEKKKKKKLWTHLHVIISKMAVKLGSEAVGNVDFPSSIKMLANRSHCAFTEIGVHGHLMISHRSTHVHNNPLDFRKNRFTLNHGSGVLAEELSCIWQFNVTLSMTSQFGH